MLSFMREKSKVKILVPPSSSSYGASWWISCKLLDDGFMICNERGQSFIRKYKSKVTNTSDDIINGRPIIMKEFLKLLSQSVGNHDNEHT